LLVLGFMAAAVSYWSWSATQTVLDASATRSAAHALFATPSVQNMLAENLSTQLDEQLTKAKINSKAVERSVDPAVEQALRDPRVTDAFADAVAQLHRLALNDGSGKVTINPGALTRAVHDALAQRDPKLAARLKTSAPLDVTLNGDKVPHLGPVRKNAGVIALAALMAALVLITGSLLLCHDRAAFARTGRRISYGAIGPLLTFLLLPRLMSHFDGHGPQIAGAVLGAYGPRIVPSAIALAVVGLLVVLGSVVWPRRAVEAEADPALAPPPAEALPSPLLPAAPGEPAINEKLYL
jgi:hypothetical protein